MLTATVERGIKKHDQAKVDKYISQQIKSYTKLRTKGHRDFKNLTDAQIREMAECMARTYNVGETFEWVAV
jgi:ribonuclease HIII